MSANILVKNPTIFRKNVRERIIEIIRDETIATNMEIAIYNYSIREATQKKIIKKWENPSFVLLYSNRLRTMYMNFKNEAFLEKIKTNEISPQDAVFMTHQEMNEPRWAALIEKKKIVDANKFNTDAIQASTTLFTCSRCKSNKCTFYSLQIRSCDEGETIFITCTNCGKRWKRNS